MKLAIVIPCRNEENAIRECIEAIYASELPESTALEVFVVDGKSHDGTLSILEELQQTYPSLNVVVNEAQVTPFAFNLGIHAGKGADYVQIVGARQIISKDYLAGALKVFQEKPDVWCVGGRVFNEYLNETGEIIATAMGSPFGMGLGNFRTLDRSGYVDTVGTPMYPYWVFGKIGYFDEELVRNQDDDFNFRVTQAGGKIYYEHDIHLKYYVRGNYIGLWRQFFQYGYWKVYVNKKHKAVTTIRQLVPPLFVLYLFLLIPSILLGSLLFLLNNIPFLLYVALCFYFATANAKTTKQIWPLIQTYVILHVSYGLGYLRGIFDFLVMGKKPSESQKRLSR